MSRPMPTGNPFLSGNLEPMNLEADCPDLRVIGEVPEALHGAYFRNGANPQFAPRRGYMAFDGDGMIHGFYFEDGKVRYRNRWVRTDRFLREREAGEALFGSMIDPGSSHESVVGVSSNSANTNVLYHGGKLLALWEAGLPTELDPKTLETRGLWDFDGKLERQIPPEIAKQLGLEANEGAGPGIVTAHPKIDPDTLAMHFFGYSPTPPCLIYGEADADGKLVRQIEIDVPYASMMHDFAMSENHIIFPLFPGVFDFESMAKGESLLAWKPELGSRIGVMPKGGDNSDVRWYETDPCFVFHTVNAHEEGDRLIIHLARFAALPLFGTESVDPPTYWRFIIDTAAGTLRQEQIDDVPTEFHRVDERFLGKPCKNSWGPCRIPGQDGFFGFGALLQYDMQTGEKKIHGSGDTTATTTFGEPVFVPRAPDAEQGDGFVLVLAYRSEEHRSDLLVLDARQIEQDPLATIQLPVRVPDGFHGNWMPFA